MAQKFRQIEIDYHAESLMLRLILPIMNTQEMLTTADRLEQQAKLLREAVALMERFGKEHITSSIRTVPPKPGTIETRPVVIKSLESQPPSVLTACEQALRERPEMRVKELFEEVTMLRGAKVKAPEYLGQMIARDARKRFEKVPGRPGYWRLVEAKPKGTIPEQYLGAIRSP